MDVSTWEAWISPSSELFWSTEQVSRQPEPCSEILSQLLTPGKGMGCGFGMTLTLLRAYGPQGLVPGEDPIR